MRLGYRRSLRVVALLAASALAFAACAGDDDQPGQVDGEQTDATIVHGTTDSVVSLDPAGSYDLGSWTIIYNVMNGLVEIPAGGNTPEPALAESCDFTDPQTYECTLKEGITFHDGSELTSEDVAHSFERNIKIADANGACSLLASLAECGKWSGNEIDTPDDRTVIFNLNTADATWPFVLTTGAAYIVPDSYPMNELQPDAQMIGTGPMSLAEYQPGVQVVLERNEDFWGDPARNARSIIQYFDQSSALKLAIQQGEVDIAYRNLTPTELADLEGREGLSVVEGAGTEIRYLVFNVNLEPGDDLAVRKAVALTIDRQAIVENVYEGTVQPLYTMVPEGLQGHSPAFAEVYGESPDPDQAEQVLNDAGVNTPVDIEIWWTPTHYGDSSADEYSEIKRALEDSGLFNVTLKSTEWDQYTTQSFGDAIYPAYQLGWFPDFPDADNYLAPFYGSKTSFLNNGYSNRRIDQLIQTERTSTDEQERIEAFEEIQQIAAEEVPIVPVWQGGQNAAVREGVTGVEETFDVSFIFRYYLLGKSE